MIIITFLQIDPHKTDTCRVYHLYLMVTKWSRVHKKRKREKEIDDTNENACVLRHVEVE
jgi:hypothetical protein